MGLQIQSRWAGLVAKGSFRFQSTWWQCCAVIEVRVPPKVGPDSSLSVLLTFIYYILGRNSSLKHYIAISPPSTPPSIHPTSSLPQIHSSLPFRKEQTAQGCQMNVAQQISIRLDEATQ